MVVTTIEELLDVHLEEGHPEEGHPEEDHLQKNHQEEGHPEEDHLQKNHQEGSHLEEGIHVVNLIFINFKINLQIIFHPPSFFAFAPHAARHPPHRKRPIPPHQIQSDQS